MNSTLVTRIFRLLRLGFFTALCMLASPAARAGLTLNIDFYRNSQGQNYVFYTPLATNDVAPAAALGTYIITSPGGTANGAQRGFDLTTNGVSDRGEFDYQGSYGDFNSAMQQITNGAWTILFTNTTTTNHYTFTVSAPTINSNLMPATIITSPTAGAINVPNQPAFTWQGPVNWPVTTANTYIYNYDFSFFQFPAPIPASQTDWTDPDPLPNGLNCTFNLDYVTNYAGPLFVATTPLNTNVSHQAISGWFTASILETGDSVSFAVTNPPAVGTTLIAHYTFDDSGNLGQDSSGNGYDLDFDGGDGVALTSDARVGSGAAYFDGNSFFGYNSTPTNVLNTLAGDFSLSFWIKTTQNDGNENGEAYAGAGIVAADVPGTAYDLVPAALDGGQIGFNTGPDDDTANSTVDINDGNYHHVVITRQEATGEKQIYIDGVLNNTDFATMNPLSDPRMVAIGCAIDASQSDPNNANPQQFFQGQLDDLQLYAGVLSSNQVEQLYASANANPTLVAHYTFDNSSNLGHDSSGNGNDLDYNGAPYGSGVTWDSDAEAGGGAAYFDGGSFFSYNSTPAAVLNTLAGDFSLSFWIKTTQTYGEDGYPAYFGAGIVAADIPGQYNDLIPAALDGGEIGFNTGPDDDTLNSTTDINDGNYHHIVITRQQATGEKQIYIDGELNNSDSASTSLLNDPKLVAIGCAIDASQSDPDNANPGQFFYGWLDDIQLYSRVLSADQVTQLYNNPGSTISFSAGLDFNPALNTTNLNWTTTGDTSWFIETTNTSDGATAAAQSGIVINNQSSTLSVTVTGPGTLTFSWACMADYSGFDYVAYLDGDPNNGYLDDLYYNTSGWYQDGPFTIPAGTHTVSWTAFANNDTDPTEAGFLGQVSYVADTAPTLTVTAAPTSGAVPLAVQFTSPTLDSFGNTVTNWNWAFGDGVTSTSQSPSHVYTTTGAFTPGLTAYSTYGSAALAVTGLGTITVSNAELNVSTIPASGLAPLTVQFASPGVDSGGNTVTNWNWSFGDGGNSTAQNPTHVYTMIGSYSPGLVAQSTHGASALPVTGLGAINVYSNPTPAFHTLYTFSPNFGTAPDGDLAISGNQLYGTTENGGGSNGIGTVFSINTDGNGFTNLYVFASGGNGYPVGGLVLSGPTLYGIGSSVFAINTNGTGYTNLLNLVSSFDSPTGYNPVAGLAVSGNTLYGTTWYGGPYDEGVIFSVATNGVSHGILYAFTQPTYNPYAINYAGIFPSARLICPAGTLYGTDEQGGSYGGGTVFSVVTNQPGSYTVLHNFTAPAVNGTNSDGDASFSGLVLSGTNLYGTTLGGGAYGNGTVFVVSTTGQFTSLYSFTGGSDGSEPQAGLTLSGNTLYGTTTTGGAFTNGTLFAINTDGSNFKSLYSFTGGNDGGDPAADLVFADGTLFGTASKGGSTGKGTIFSFALAGPPLAIALSGTNVILTWSTAYSGYTLQSSAELGAGAAWSSVSPLPVVLNNLNTVTNPVSTMTKFYRLSQ